MVEKTRNQVVAQAARGFESHPIRHIAGAKRTLLRHFYAQIPSICAFGDSLFAPKVPALRQSKAIKGGQQRQGCKAQQVNGGFKHMNVLRIRLSLQEKREVLVTAGQLALIAAGGAAQSAISRLALLIG